VCTGALGLAAAGLLDGYRATTHWASCDRLTGGHPLVRLQPDQLYVRDRDRWTSAGISAGLDLGLAMVEADFGSDVARAVASWLVVFARRPGGQVQFVPEQRRPPVRHPAIAGVQAWLADHLDADLTVDALARRAGMSPRHFARLFRSEAGSTPASAVEAARVEAAKELLQSTDQSVAAVAAAVGFRRPETLHRAFQRQVRTTPDRYRQHFHTGLP
jgi:transcriptional regulator GlxA family with amidase domain